MNNLLRTLTESQVRRTGDLRLLLTTVKDGRRQSHDTKISDPFYDSLEGLLTDLKTITIDNRDAEAFLKPVSKSEVPDYYDVIQNAMDFQTMLRKVKQKQYKSKREFKDDLDLIWSNCLTYNAAENHPLRPCVKRLKVKAERLLKYITDRKERTDPPIPSDLPPTGVARPRMNGMNGRGGSHTRSPSLTNGSTPISRTSTKYRRDIPFADTPAIIRTPEGMAQFLELDREAATAYPSSSLVHTLRLLGPPVEGDSDGDEPSSTDGTKRKMNNTDRRPRKRARFEEGDVSQLWWGAVQSEELLGNGLPGIPFGPSSSRHTAPKAKVKRPKKAREAPPPPNPKSLLSMMNNNIKTMRRLRDTHGKFAALNAATAPADEEEQGGDGAPYGPSATGAGPRASGLAAVAATSFGVGDDDVADDKIDESPWTPGKGKTKSTRKGIELGEANSRDCLQWTTSKILEHSGFQGTSSVALDVLADVTAEYLLNVGRTIKFLTDKFAGTMTAEEIILHTLFESGSSKVQDLERYIFEDVDRYGTRLGELEKKIVSAYRETTAGELLEDEGLFEEEDEEETGALAIGEFADILGEDYLGLRELGIAAEFGMSNLSIPKRLLKGKKGQNKPAASKPTEPPPPYPPPPPFIPLTAAKVPDQIGLLKPYYQDRFTMLAATNAGPSGTIPSLAGPSLNIGGPSLLLPPPPPPNMLPPAPAAAFGFAPPLPTSAAAPAVPSFPSPPPDLALPDDLPHPSQVKITPIGQVVKVSGVSSTSKKKKGAGADVGLSAPPVTGPPPTVSGSTAPPPLVSGSIPAPVGGMPGGGEAPGAAAGAKKKKSGMVGVGTGNGRKKKPDGPPGTGGYASPVMPAVVFASA